MFFWFSKMLQISLISLNSSNFVSLFPISFLISYLHIRLSKLRSSLSSPRQPSEHLLHFLANFFFAFLFLLLYSFIAFLSPAIGCLNGRSNFYLAKRDLLLFTNPLAHCCDCHDTVAIFQGVL